MPKNKEEKPIVSKSNFPKKIYIIRHGEKPDDEDIPDLSIQGVTRAHYLIDYWTKQNVPNPDIIYCFRNKHGIRNRSYELMTPLSEKYKIKVNSDFRDKADEKVLVDHVMSNNADKIVLICWEHKNISFIIKSIYDILTKNNNIDKKIKYWSLDPSRGVNYKSDKFEDDHELYSLTIMIDVESRLLTGLSQSNIFINDTFLKEQPINILFSIDG